MRHFSRHWLITFLSFLLMLGTINHRTGFVGKILVWPKVGSRARFFEFEYLLNHLNGFSKFLYGDTKFGGEYSEKAFVVVSVQLVSWITVRSNHRQGNIPNNLANSPYFYYWILINTQSSLQSRFVTILLRLNCDVIDVTWSHLLKSKFRKTKYTIRKSVKK